MGDAFAAAAQQVPQQPLLDIEDIGGPFGQVALSSRWKTWA